MLALVLTQSELIAIRCTLELSVIGELGLVSSRQTRGVFDVSPDEEYSA